MATTPTLTGETSLLHSPPLAYAQSVLYETVLLKKKTNGEYVVINCSDNAVSVEN